MRHTLDIIANIEGAYFDPDGKVVLVLDKKCKPELTIRMVNALRGKKVRIRMEVEL